MLRTKIQAAIRLASQEESKYLFSYQYVLYNLWHMLVIKITRLSGVQVFSFSSRVWLFSVSGD